MRKIEELASRKSCMNRAGDYEMVFVLLGRDAAAPLTIRTWANQRVALGLNKLEDPQITAAFDCADTMDAERECVRQSLKDNK